MKTSISVATFLLAGAGVAGAGAVLPATFQGSDTLFNLTRDAITAVGTIGPATAYIGGGSGNGQSAMVGGSQHIAPMSRMMNSGGGLCGQNTANATGIVIGLDAVDVLSSLETGAAAVLSNGGPGCNVDGGGLAFDGTNGQSFSNYKNVLALIYGGLDNQTGTVDCNSARRQAVVSAWSHSFENSCANPDGACNDATHGGKLWHAFRRDDASGTSDVFATVLGLSPSTSAAAVNGFGTSPYCNALNWDTSSGNASCVLGKGKQWTGPGGIPQGVCTGGTVPAGTLCWINLDTCSVGGAPCSPVGSTCNSTGTCQGPGVCLQPSGGTGANPDAKCAFSCSVGGSCTQPGAACTFPGSCQTNLTCSAGGAACSPSGSACTGNGTCQSGTTSPCGDGQTTCQDQCGGGTCAAIDATHRRPPLNTWGDNPDPSAGALGGGRGADVMPTSFQDNDPIRRPCIGTVTNNALRAGEEVCNVDGTLGLVIPIASSDFIANLNDPNNPSNKLLQYPVNACNTSLAGLPAAVHTCAIRAGQATGGTHHSGQCPNGDSQLLGKCQVPVDQNANGGAGSSQCVATRATSTGVKNRIIAFDGRIFNLQMHDGTSGTGGTIGYLKETIPTASGATQLLCGDATTCQNPGGSCADGSVCGIRFALDFAGAFDRIHQVQSIPSNLGGCKLKDATDAIGCLVHADRCSIGYAGDGATTWGQRNNPIVASDIGPIQVNHVMPSTMSVQLLGDGPLEYPLARKLYLSSLIGFAAGVLPDAGSSEGGITQDELQLARFESAPGDDAGPPPNGINPILINDGFFTLGSSSPRGPDIPYCEDFNQALVCDAGLGNDNACFRNPQIWQLPFDTSADPDAAIFSTVCGNGRVETNEECDPAAPINVCSIGWCADGSGPCDSTLGLCGTSGTARCDLNTSCATVGSACSTGGVNGTCQTNWQCSVPGATTCTATCRC